MKRNLKKVLKNQRGITLVALVITIVILIILATVTINFAFGDSGIIKKAEEAKDMTANSTELERENINQLVEEFESRMPFEPTPTPEPPTGGTEMADMTNGIIEIKWLSGTSYNVSETPNAPVIKTDLPEGTTMELVRYTGEGTTEQERWVAGTEYSYVAGTGSSDNNSSKWANARVTIDGVDSYFVWIPRYAYRIIYFKDTESKKAYQEGTLTEADAVASGKIIGYSDSRGIVDAQGRKIDSVTSESNTTKTMVSKDYFMVHPAFINDVDAGGWTSELPGIWVGKYEPSGTISQLKVQPGVESLINQKIGTFYTAGLGYAEDLQSHMLKNSERGAVVYLTESKYGRNGIEITQNTSYYTGGGSETAYITNVSQSSTGNVYGIYDLSGGRYEYVAAYYSGLDANSTYIGNGLPFASIGGTSDEYSTAYSGTSASSAYKYGDATYETSGWHLDGANFVNSTYPFFERGGWWKYASAGNGMFSYTDGHGNIGAERCLLFPPRTSSVMEYVKNFV